MQHTYATYSGRPLELLTFRVPNWLQYVAVTFICIWVDVISTFTVYTQYEWRSISLYTPLEDFPTVPNHQAGQQAPKSHRQPVSTIKTIASGTASLACAYSAVVPARNPQTSVVGVEGNGKIWSPTPKRFKDEGLSSNSYDLDGPPRP